MHCHVVDVHISVVGAWIIIVRSFLLLPASSHRRSSFPASSPFRDMSHVVVKDVMPLAEAIACPSQDILRCRQAVVQGSSNIGAE